MEYEMGIGAKIRLAILQEQLEKAKKTNAKTPASIKRKENLIECLKNSIKSEKKEIKANLQKQLETRLKEKEKIEKEIEKL